MERKFTFLNMLHLEVYFDISERYDDMNPGVIMCPDCPEWTVSIMEEWRLFGILSFSMFFEN